MEYYGDFIDGRFRLPERSDGEIKVMSPGDLKDHVMTLQFRNDHVEEACVAAKKAFESWSTLSLDERKAYVLKIKELYQAHKNDLAEVISRETGKPLWEALNEVQTMVNKVDVTLQVSMPLVAEQKIENALPQVDGYVRFKPRGVMAVLGPFNFPGHLPNGHIIPALLTGNTVVFKPSEKTPVTGQMIAYIVQKAGLPPGVFNLVQGDGGVGRRLAISENVDGVLFTGSYEVGLRIKQETLTHFWKILALEMGGKNATIVWNDCDIEKAIYETLVASFVSAGQRCSCTSRIILHSSIAEMFISRFYEAAKKLTIGHWKDNPFMGPLISADAVEKYIRFQEIAKREGSESLMRGKSLDTDRQGYYVTPSIMLVKEINKDSVYQRSEIFGPNVAIYTVDDFDQALALNNSSGFGLVMSVFTKNRALYERAIAKAQVGLVNWNRTTNGASSKLPFGGMNKSGNDRPTASFAVYYTTVPVASLEDHTPFDRSQVLPGMNWT
jgi:succinylglutamic semialdehyde dehydrogenase